MVSTPSLSLVEVNAVTLVASTVPDAGTSALVWNFRDEGVTGLPESSARVASVAVNTEYGVSAALVQVLCGASHEPGRFVASLAVVAPVTRSEKAMVVVRGST